MKPADHRIDFVYASHFLCAPAGVNEAAVATGADHDESSIPQPETGGVLMPVLIGHHLSREFLGSKMVVHVGVGVTAEPVPSTVLHPSIWQHLLNAGSGDCASGKGVALHDDRHL